MEFKTLLLGFYYIGSLGFLVYLSVIIDDYFSSRIYEYCKENWWGCLILLFCFGVAISVSFVCIIKLIYF